MIHAYLDWNVFNRIEKKVEPIYQQIEQFILENKINIPYSNAHINDLVRGYEKNKDYTKGHLSTLSRLTNNLCIVQYWGQRNTIWHYRDVSEFFNSSLEDIETTTTSFSNLYSSYLKDDIPEVHSLWQMQLSLLRSQSLPFEFKQVYKDNPVFDLIFPKSKVEMNMLSFCEDLYDFSYRAKKDFALYKTFRNYINQSRIKFKEQPKIYRQLDKTMAGIPNHLVYDTIWEKYTGKNKVTDNTKYSQITNTYLKIDFRGIKSDEKFANLIDDSLHVFYGAHCDYFITLNKLCKYKAIETFKELKIKTIVLAPNEFLEQMGSL